MTDIQMLSDQIEDEIADADKYIMCALEEKERKPVMAELHYKLSVGELQHMTELHDMVVKLIEEYRKAHGDPPADMQARYDYLHKRHIKAATDVRVKQAAYKAS